MGGSFLSSRLGGLELYSLYGYLYSFSQVVRTILRGASLSRLAYFRYLNGYLHGSQVRTYFSGLRGQVRYRYGSFWVNSLFYDRGVLLVCGDRARIRAFWLCRLPKCLLFRSLPGCRGLLEAFKEVRVPSLGRSSCVRTFSRSSSLRLRAFRLPILPCGRSLRESIRRPKDVPTQVLPISSPTSRTHCLHDERSQEFLFL